MSPTILAIETSCDETAASLVKNEKILSNVVNSQIIHEKYGGVVPELASRSHQKNIVDIVDRAFNLSGISRESLDAIAVTKGPGLIGSLLVGVSFAKGMALALDVPLIAINHMEAHIFANFIDSPKPEFPFLCLTVSGGHTQIVLVKDYVDLTVIGKTQDDAVGEAFDKAAKIMGLPYPGGPVIDKLAQIGDPNAFTFPDTKMPSLDFSFSGIKTAFLYFVRKATAKDPSFLQQRKADLCASLQKKLIEMLLSRLEKASLTTRIKHIAIAGGVSANSGLREALRVKGAQLGWNIFIPSIQYCTDNAAMIAMAAHYKFMNRAFSTLHLAPLARYPVGAS